MNENPQILLFSNHFLYPYRFQLTLKIIRVIQIKKRIIAVIYFPLSIQLNILTLNNNNFNNIYA